MRTYWIKHGSDQEAGNKILWTSGVDASPFLFQTSLNKISEELQVMFWKADCTVDIFIPENHLSG